MERESDGPNTVFESACLRGDTPLAMRAIKDSRFNLEQRDDWGFTPLILAAWSRQPEVIESLIATGADVFACTCEGNTAVHLCMNRGDVSIRCLEMLMRHGGGWSVFVPNAAGETPLDLSRHREATELLENEKRRIKGTYFSSLSVVIGVKDLVLTVIEFIY